MHPLITSAPGGRRAGRCARLAASALLGCAMLSIVACGSGSSSTDSGTSTAQAGASPSAALRLADQQIGALYRGTYKLPQGTLSSKPPGGKNLWVITASLAAESPANAARGFKEAASHLGWHVTVFDGKYDPNQWLTGIREAIQAHADGIWTYAFDCASVKAAMSDAKRAHIPLVIAEGQDCGTGADALAAHVTSYNTTEHNGLVLQQTGDVLDYNRAFGAVGAWWLVAHTNARAKLILFEESDVAATVAVAQGVKDVFARCGSCKIVDTVKFTGADIGPKLQQKAQQALIQHPDATAVHANYDTAVTSGVAAAIQGTNRKILMAGGEGFAANIALVRRGIQNAGSGSEAAWEGWAGVDDFAHLLTNSPPRPNSGFGVMLYDKDHNLPPVGQGFKTGIDYPGAFLKSWRVQ